MGQQLTNAEAQLMQALETHADAYDSYFDDSADAPIITKQGASGVKLTHAKGNPTFAAQFDITATIKYFTLNGGAYTNVLPANINAGLKTALPVFLFGWNDFKSGYAKLQQQFAVNANWTYGIPFVYGARTPSELALDVNVTALLSKGDVCIPFTSALPGAGTTSLALVIIHCTQVAYGTLLESLVSDKFVMNMIRYVVPDETAPSLAQFGNNIGIFKQSLFGKFNSDYVSPNSFKKPEQMQKNLIDVPLKKGINKEISIATMLNYDCTTFSWSTFVWTVHKL